MKVSYLWVFLRKKRKEKEKEFLKIYFFNNFLSDLKRFERKFIKYVCDILILPI